MTGITWHVVGCGYPVADFVLSNTLTNLRNLTCNFMTKDKRRLMNPVPFHDITTADPTRHDLHKHFTGADLRNWHLFNPDIPVVVIHCYAHRWQNISICPKINLYPGGSCSNASVKGGKVWFYYFILHKPLAMDLRLQVF